MDWPVLFPLADTHGMLGLLAARLNEFGIAKQLPNDAGRKLQERVRAQVIHSLSLTAELFRIIDGFEAQGIGVLAIKGPVLSVQAFGDAGIRSYSDLDFLVRPSEIYRAAQLMMEAGYKSTVPLSAITAGRVPGQYMFTRAGSNLLVEFHNQQTMRYFPRLLPLEAFFERQIRVPMDGHEIPAPSVEDELVLICIHGAKHLWERLMWIADVAALVTRQRDLDWEATFKVAKEIGAARVLKTALHLAHDLLKAPLPAAVRAEIEKDKAAVQLSAQISHLLLHRGSTTPGVLERAVFRMRMRGGLFAGPMHLLRLSLSPTEEDWVDAAETKNYWSLEAIRRSVRLVRKYGFRRKQ